MEDIEKDSINLSRKNVTFASPIVSKEYILHEEDRTSPWEEIARDRARFRKRIANVEHTLKPMLIKCTLKNNTYVHYRPL